MVPFWQDAHALENVILVRYEDLINDAAAWDRLFRFVAWPRTRALNEAILARPSRTSRVGSDKCEADELTPDDLAAVKTIVEHYGASEWLLDRSPDENCSWARSRRSR
jgi:hypothetical protein